MGPGVNETEGTHDNNSVRNDSVREHTNSPRVYHKIESQIPKCTWFPLLKIVIQHWSLLLIRKESLHTEFGALTLALPLQVKCDFIILSHNN